MRLSQIVGAQVAWWQLGFRARRAALRQLASPDVMAVAREWSHQVLSAPWWWRLTRVLMLGAVAVLGCASVLVVALDGKDESVMVHYALLTALPVLAASAWWQTHCARKLAVQIGPPPPRRSRAWMAVQALAFIVAVSVLIAAIVRAAVVESEQHARCPAVIVDDDVLEFTEDRSVCALASTATDFTGFRHTPVGDVRVRNHVYAIPGVGTMIITHSMVRAWHSQLRELGAPVDYPRSDGQIWFLNFEHGYVSADLSVDETGASVSAVVGRRYEPVSKVGDCPYPDRPCVVSVERTENSLTVVWSSPDADAFNVQWWEERTKPGPGVEVAARRFTIRDADPGRSYGFSIESCKKRFLGRSTCTKWSPTVVVPRSLPDPGSAGAGRR
ncbi:fibronectin type III domain-containing protein [Lentzea alba]|uniref:fibronectin type III domain-containing protein n=1 Tax=Lentzea alba TaxID=2714351 RepID=UPI0039BFC5EA